MVELMCYYFTIFAIFHKSRVAAKCATTINMVHKASRIYSIPSIVAGNRTQLKPVRGTTHEGYIRKPNHMSNIVNEKNSANTVTYHGTTVFGIITSPSIRESSHKRSGIPDSTHSVNE